MDNLFADPILLSCLTAEEVEALLLCEENSPPRRFRSRRGLLNLSGMDEDVIQQFRFEKDDIARLACALRLPQKVTVSPGIKVSQEEALCVALRRLAYPNRLWDLEEQFGRHRTTISLLTTEVLTQIDTNFGYLLGRPSSHRWLNLDCLETFAQVQYQWKCNG